jgi:cytochrome c peroxidase
LHLSLGSCTHKPTRVRILGQCALLLTLLLALHPANANRQSVVDLTPAELTLLKGFGTWPPAPANDGSNRASGEVAAIQLGRMLFADTRLSHDQSMSCASCHQPDNWFQDGRALSQGRETLTRNTPSIVDIAWSRWFGWDGAHDNMWSLSLRALTATSEMASTPASLATFLRADATYGCGLSVVFDLDPEAASDEQIFVALGKLLAAYMQTLISAPSSFDRFRMALDTGNRVVVDAYPDAAKRGLKLFVGHGRCHFCHFGPRLTNDEFADVTVPYFTNKGVDKGRFDGIRKLLRSPYTRIGQHSDNTTSLAADYTRYVQSRSRNFGEFKVPSLRNVARTSPYMHDGSLASLDDVVRHYSEIDENRLHGRVDQLLRPLKLDRQQTSDLVAFLRTLSSDSTLSTFAQTATQPVCK